MLLQGLRDEAATYLKLSAEGRFADAIYELYILLDEETAKMYVMHLAALNENKTSARPLKRIRLEEEAIKLSDTVSGNEICRPVVASAEPRFLSAVVAIAIVLYLILKTALDHDSSQLLQCVFRRLGLDILGL